MKKREGHLTLAALDRSSGVPLHAQIAAEIRNAIREGSLVSGGLLPSTRDLAKQLGVSRNTAMAAYETLARQALIVGTVGSGTRVSGRLPVIQVSEGAWRKAIQESRYPQRMAPFQDQDGNLLYLCKR